jgi:hypothetical protein
MQLKSLTLTAACAALLLTQSGLQAAPSGTIPVSSRKNGSDVAIRRHHVGAEAATSAIDGNTGTGKGTTVQLLDGVKLIFDNVTTSGNTTATRTDLAPGVRLSPCGTPIPTYLTPPAGDNHFAIFRIETTAGFTDAISINLSHPDTNSRVFRAACPPPRDAGWEDVTTIPVPGDPRGRVPGFSEFVIVTDTRPTSTLINNKLNALIGLVGPGSKAAQFVDPTTLATLQSMVSAVASAIAANDKPSAIVGLQNFNQFVVANSGTTIPNSLSSPGGNIAGTLEAKASTLIFSLSL